MCFDTYMHEQIIQHHEALENCLYPPAIIFEDYIETITRYLVSKIDEDSSQNEEFQNLISALSKKLTSICIGSRLETDHLTMTLGFIVEGLIFYGMPRKPAIIATADWLKVSPSTVRTANEKYRSRDLSRLDFHIQCRTNRMIIKVRDYILSNPSFPMAHPKALSAFTDLSEHIKRISAEILAIEKCLKKTKK